MIAEPDDRWQRFQALSLHLVVLALLALQVYVRRLPATVGAIPEADEPEALWWGLWPITYLPPSFFIAGALVIVGLIIYLWWTELSAHSLPQIGWSYRQRWLALSILALLMLVAFFVFPIAHTRWGDAYIISRTIAWPTEELRLTHTWQAPLDVFLHSRVWLLTREWIGWEDAAPVYRLLSPIAGAIFLVALLMLSRIRQFAPGWLTFGLVASLGIIQLFFGYIENYSFAAAFVLVTLWLGIANRMNRVPLWAVATAVALANAFHPSTIVLIPSLLALAWFQFQTNQPSVSADESISGGNKRKLSVVIQTVAPLAIIYGMTWLMMELGNHGLRVLFTTDRPGGGDASWFVPLRQTTTDWQHYTLFSRAHARDIINEQLLVAPVVLPSLIALSLARLFQRIGQSKNSAIAVNRQPVSKQESQVRTYLIIATVSYLLLIWLWNPDYGGQRDWDLFSLAALPSALLLVYVLSHNQTKRMLVISALPLIAVQTLHTVAWVYQNTLPWSWP